MINENLTPKKPLPTPEQEARLLEILHDYADQLGLDRSEFEIAGFFAWSLDPKASSRGSSIPP